MPLDGWYRTTCSFSGDAGMSRLALLIAHFRHYMFYIFCNGQRLYCSPNLQGSCMIYDRVLGSENKWCIGPPRLEQFVILLRGSCWIVDFFFEYLGQRLTEAHIISIWLDIHIQFILCSNCNLHKSKLFLVLPHNIPNHGILFPFISKLSPGSTFSSFMQQYFSHY